MKMLASIFLIISTVIYVEYRSGDQFESKTTKRKYRVNFSFGCNSCCEVYLLSFKVCHTQYVESILTRFSLKFNQYISNIKLYREKGRGFKQEKLI